MRYKELREIVKYLQNFHTIDQIERVQDNTIHMRLDGKDIFFDLGRSKNLIYLREDFTKIRHYNAPFDKVLAKRCKKSRIEKIELDENDKIIRIHCLLRSSYKEERTILQLEFTGRHANAIILDDKGNVLEALHHDYHRDIRPGRPLHPLPPPKKLDKSPLAIENMEKYLRDLYEKERQKRLSILKSAKSLQLSKQEQKLHKLLEGLEKEEDLWKKAEEEEKKANILLANLHQIPAYQECFKTEDFEGNPITIELPKEAQNPAHGARLLFAKAKKLRQKAANIHIQRENIEEKLKFLAKKRAIIQRAKTPEQIELLFPKRAKSKSKKEKNYEKFVIDGFGVYVGKNKRGNVELLKKAKANDVWLHLKDLPSAHVIVATNKQNLPAHILEQAAKLCAQFSVEHPGKYLVDYTQRRNVKPKEGANVKYVKYKTIPVTIEQ